MRYYEIVHAFPKSGRWYLNGLTDATGERLDSRWFSYGLPIDIGPPFRLPLQSNGQLVDVAPPLTTSLRRVGPPLDFTLADYDVPMVTRRVSDILAGIAENDIQRFEVIVPSRSEGYHIINASYRLPCIDSDRSEIEYWQEEDGRPNKVGKPRMVGKLVIDSSLAGGHHIFRPDGWEVVLIVSDTVKQALEKAKVTGIEFRAVSV